ncbi:unnamed protein product [Orchesella dallaii]|uniref:C2H2-type domain-containing protein n=1 Tax=Orchesella dallaii TaxID=48710 RepID=A0ABP1QIG6_9HEXA
MDQVDNEMASWTENQDFKDNFICKSRLCVFCTKLIVNEPSKVNVSSSEAFLKGVQVLCNVLQLEQRFVSEDLWRLAGTENFINFICCAQCSNLLTNLVSLHELIIAKKAALEGDVKEIEKIILETSERSDDLEFASNTCVLFRDEILKGHQFRASTNSINHQTEDESIVVPILIPEPFTAKAEPKAKRSKRFTSRPPPPRRNKKRKTINKNGVLGCYVKLERCDVDENPESSTVAAPAFELDEEDTLHEKRDFKDDDVDFDFEPSHLLDSPEQSSDEEFVPEKKKREKPIGKRRGRPPKKRSITEDQPRRKRGRPRTKPIDASKPARKIIKWRNKYGLSGRDVKQDKYLHDGHYFKPVLVVDATKGDYMFMHVKFKQENRTLLCQHPRCPYSVYFGACFSEHDAYKSIRFHIQNEHRNYYTHEGEYEEENKYYCCYHCDSHFPTRQPLSDHVRQEHGEAPVNSLCEICCCTLPGADLVEHIFTHKNEDEQSQALQGTRKVRDGKLKYRILPSEFPCDQCHRVCKSYTELRLHKISHVPIEMRRQYQCEMCPTRLSALSSLQKHIESVHNREALETPYICRYCGRTYNKNQKIKYDIHLRQHTGERPFKCSVCDKGFTSQEQMARHEIVHKNLQIQCEFCSSVYKHPTYLRRHHRKHHPDLIPRKANITANKCPVPQEYEEGFIGPRMAYPCEPCAKVFIFKSQLISHMKHRHKLELPSKEDYPNQNIFEDGLYDRKVKKEVDRNVGRASGSASNFATPFYLPGYGLV